MRGLKGSVTLLRMAVAPRLEARTRHPRRHRLRVEAQRPGGLRDRQALAIMAVVDFAERSRNRSRPAKLAVRRGFAVHAADVARMSWPSRSKRSVVRTMSSCNGVPTKWAISRNQNSRLCQQDLL